MISGPLNFAIFPVLPTKSGTQWEFTKYSRVSRDLQRVSFLTDVRFMMGKLRPRAKVLTLGYVTTDRRVGRAGTSSMTVSPGMV